ncbi:hypothetical protein B0I75DRAFT_142354 [Yarrowia lipolytica]|nr:hypothetical protein B0I74DRAFT_142516 [Yarrowia lipolytica]RDW49917.1 hypothetical protein B0I75DRAFT_142354 [Yarrowia lipolytica]
MAHLQVQHQLPTAFCARGSSTQARWLWSSLLLMALACFSSGSHWQETLSSYGLIGTHWLIVMALALSLWHMFSRCWPSALAVHSFTFALSSSFHSVTLVLA